MSDAKVNDLAVLADFRVALAEFAGQVRRALTDVQLEVRRGMEWITEDRPTHWRYEVRRSGEALAHAKDELSHAKTYKQIGDYIPACIDEKKAVEKAKKRLEYAEEKVEITRNWIIATRHAVDEFQGPVQQLMGLLDSDIPRAIMLLERMSAALEQYATGAAPTGINWEDLVKQVASMARPADAGEAPPAKKPAIVPGGVADPSTGAPAKESSLP
jgi:hypothetical protein